MDVKLRRADIVIMASAHNPSIVDPHWLKANGLVAEDPKHFVHTPDFFARTKKICGSLRVDKTKLFRKFTPRFNLVKPKLHVQKVF